MPLTAMIQMCDNRLQVFSGAASADFIEIWRLGGRFGQESSLPGGVMRSLEGLEGRPAAAIVTLADGATIGWPANGRRRAG